MSNGTMQQIRCTNCGRQWSTAVNKKLFAVVAGIRTHVSCLRLLQGFALIVLAVPMSRVEFLVKIKAETIKEKLLLCLVPGRWPQLREILKDQFKIPTFYLSTFEGVIVVGAEIGQTDFLDWSKEIRREGGAERATRARLVSRILQRNVSVLEITSKKTKQAGKIAVGPR